LPELENCRDQLAAALARQGVAIEQLHWQLFSQPIPPAFASKRRRIIRQTTP
jgi:hypothetical protein